MIYIYIWLGQLWSIVFNSYSSEEMLTTIIHYSTLFLFNVI